MLAKLADLKLRLDITDTSQDSLLTGLLTSVGTLLNAYTSRTLEYAGAPTVEYFDGDGFDLRLRAFPLSTSASLAVRVADGASDFATPADEDAELYAVNRARGVLTRLPRGARWPDGVQNLRVTYTGGYTDPGGASVSGLAAVPTHVQEAALLQAVELYNRRKEPGYKTVWASGEQNAGYAPDVQLLTIVKQMLAEELRIT